jgi:hypothetical protein
VTYAGRLEEWHASMMTNDEESKVLQVMDVVLTAIVWLTLAQRDPTKTVRTVKARNKGEGAVCSTKLPVYASLVNIINTVE